MPDATTIPAEFQESFRRLYPYMIASLTTDPETIEAIILYLKLGDERLARIAIEAMNANHRLTEAALKRKLREEMMLREMIDDSEEEDDESEDEEEDEEEDI